jgi:hypothetical protein
MPVPVPIHIGTEVTVTAHGSVLMTVRCKGCQHIYRYEMFRSEPGGSFSLFSLDNEGAAERGAVIANAALRRSLENGYDLVPCPECGTYQPNMLPELRWRYRSSLRTAGICILLVTGLWFAIVALAFDPEESVLPEWATWMVWATAGLGIGLIVFRWYIGFPHC